MRKNSQQRLWRFIFQAALTGALFCLAIVIGYYCSRFWSARKYEEIREQAALSEQESISESGAETEEWDAFKRNPTLEEIENAEFTGIIDAPEPEIPKEVLTDAEDHPVDFDKLEQINSEIFAWIRVPGTHIDYPVAQHAGEPQDYYLKHDLYGTPQFAGCIFSQEPSAKDLSDPVTVFYGHNMRNGSMFQNLYHFLEAGAMAEEPYVYVYTKDNTLVYRVYSAYYGDDRNITQIYDFSNPRELEEYLEQTKKPRSMEAVTVDADQVSKEDQILTLSTCVAGRPSERLLVQAVLVHKS